MSKRLNDLIDERIAEAREREGCFNIHGIVQSLLPGLDDADRERLATMALSKLVKERGTKGKVELRRRAASRQADLPFDLHRAYSVDVEDRVVKDTVALTRPELRRVIQIRKTQLQHDAAHIRELEKAEIATAPYWDAHPDWTFGQALEAAASATDWAA